MFASEAWSGVSLAVLLKALSGAVLEVALALSEVSLVVALEAWSGVSWAARSVG